jgi:hypothetical protein
MSQDIMMFAVNDIKTMANFILENSYDCDNSGSITRHGLMYCTSCGAYDFNNGNGITHEQNCVTKIAQDVLTGIQD